MTGEPVFLLTVHTTTVGDVSLLAAEGVLDSTTYRFMRDSIIKAALDEPSAVVVDVSDVTVPTESALAVFTSARWHVSTWPDIPIVLVCNHSAGRAAIVRNGVARYVPVYPTTESALAAVADGRAPPNRRRARAELPADLSSLRRARELVAERLTAWGMPDFVAAAKVVVTAFMENVLQHTDCRPNLRVETNGTTVTVAVADSSAAPAGVREQREAGAGPSGLRLVTALCRAWGNAPTPSGKTVWAVIGPENRL